MSSKLDESNELLARLASEVTRLKDERRGLRLSVDSLAEENALLQEKVGEYKRKTSTLASRVEALLNDRGEEEAEKRKAKMYNDLSSLRQIEAEAHLHIMQDQQAEMRQREARMLVEAEAMQKENSALKAYIGRLETLAKELHQDKQREQEAKQRLETKILALNREAELTKQLSLLQEEHDKPLTLQIVLLTKRLQKKEARIQKLLKAIRKYELLTAEM